MGSLGSNGMPWASNNLRSLSKRPSMPFSDYFLSPSWDPTRRAAELAPGLRQRPQPAARGGAWRSHCSGARNQCGLNKHHVISDMGFMILQICRKQESLKRSWQMGRNMTNKWMGTSFIWFHGHKKYMEIPATPNLIVGPLLLPRASSLLRPDLMCLAAMASVCEVAFMWFNVRLDDSSFSSTSVKTVLSSPSKCFLMAFLKTGSPWKMLCHPQDSPCEGPLSEGT